MKKFEHVFLGLVFSVPLALLADAVIFSSDPILIKILRFLMQ